MSYAKKTRFDGLDCAAVTTEIRDTLLGSKLANVYDGASSSGGGGGGGNHSNTSTYLFKLVAPSRDNERSVLLIESGVRLHVSTAQTTSSDGGGPSPFAARLRRSLNSKRLENVTQLGNLDRVVDLRFGSGAEGSFHVVAEFYAKGNIILTDHRYKILALLRSHEYSAGQDNGNDERSRTTTTTTTTIDRAEGGGHVKVAVGQIYPVTFATSSNSKDVDPAADAVPSSLMDMDAEQALRWIGTEAAAYASFRKRQQGANDATTKKTKKKKKKNDAEWLVLRAALLKPSSGVHHYGPSLLDHCVETAGLSPHLRLACLPADDDDDASFELDPSVLSLERTSDLLDRLRREGASVIRALTTPRGGDADDGPRGHVVLAPRAPDDGDDDDDRVLLRFQPRLLRRDRDVDVLRFPTFSAAVDAFFASAEKRRRAAAARAARRAAEERVAAVRRDQADRAAALERETEELRLRAVLIEARAPRVGDCLDVINAALDAGTDWSDLETLVRMETNNGNPVASTVVGLDLANGTIVLGLTNDDDDGIVHRVPVRLDRTPHQNSRDLFERHRVAKEKARRTAGAHRDALAAAEATARRRAAEARRRGPADDGPATVRKLFWFEKFRWFVTSDDHLVLAGRDAHQNETLVRRYLRPGDKYLHADVFGAASCVVRAKRRRTTSTHTGARATKVSPVTERALREAGQFTVCSSSAWTSKTITSAWCVDSHQVSKTAPSGEYLTVGSFMVKGKKTYLPPVPLEMGLAVMFRLGDEASQARHKNERRDLTLDPEEEENNDDDADAPTVEAEKVERLDDDDASRTNRETSENEEDRAPDAVSPARANDDDDEAKGAPVAETAEAVDAPSAAVPIGTTTNPSRPKKKGLSARDRRLIKKYGSLEEAERRSAAAAERSSAETDDAPPVVVADDAPPPPSAPRRSRGKRGKARRAAKKYADQDEEDRRLALLALHGDGAKRKGGGGRKGGSSGNVAPPPPSATQVRAEEDALRLLVRDAATAAGRLPEDVRDVLRSCVAATTTNDDGSTVVVARWDKFDADVLEKLSAMEPPEAMLAAAKRLRSLTSTARVDNYAASLAGILRTIERYGHETLLKELEEEEDDDDDDGTGRRRRTRAERRAEEETWRRILAEDGTLPDGDDDDDDDAVDDSSELVKLTGRPLPEDVLACAVPVCAPYHALSQYRHRIKLTPGSLKRGKAVKQCLEMMLSSSNGHQRRPDENGTDVGQVAEKRYKDLIKAVGQNEWVQAICGDVKISAPGASKVAKSMKKGYKKGGSGKKKK